MRQYLDLLRYVLDHGHRKSDRTGTGTLSVFGYQMRFDLMKGFPLLTTKKLYTRAIIHELLWFLRGDSNIKYLVDNGVNIWNEWAFNRYLRDTQRDSWQLGEEEWKPQLAEYVERIRTDDEFAQRYGNLGPVYGVQWRQWPNFISCGTGRTDGAGFYQNRPIDQIAQVQADILRNPDSRRLIVTAWNPAEVPDMALPPCHALFQFYVHDGRLSCQLYQRSCDVFLGVPFNIASYALLVMMMAQACGLQPDEFVWTGGDVHLYLNHIEQARLQLTREPRPLPAMRLNPVLEDIFGFRFEDFTLEGYDPHPHIKGAISV